MDCLWLLASTLVLVGLLDPHIEQQILRHRWYSLLGMGKLWLALGFIVSCMAAIAVTAGWKKLNPNSALILLVACVLSLAAFTWSLSDVTKAWGFGLDFYSQNRTPKNSILNNQSMVGFLVLATGSMIGGFVVLFSATRFFVWLIGGMKRSTSSRVQLSRTAILIGLAVILFIAKVAQDLCFPMGVLHGLNSVRMRP